MPVFMPKRLSTLRTSLPNRQVSRHLLLNDLSLQGGESVLASSQGDTDRFEPFGFLFQASQFLDRLTRFTLADQLNLEFHGTLLSV
jgi:hypothetical protein